MASDTRSPKEIARDIERERAKLAESLNELQQSFDLEQSSWVKGAWRFPHRYPEEIDDTHVSPFATMVAHGLIGSDRARRFEALMHILETPESDVWSITRLKKNPGAFMAEVARHCPQVMSDSKRKDAEPVVAITAADLKELFEVVFKAAGPGFATGRQMHARLARSGPPLEITTRGLPRRHQSRLSIDEAVAARPMATSPSAKKV